jgi:hypothetical protein
VIGVHLVEAWCHERALVAVRDAGGDPVPGEVEVQPFRLVPGRGHDIVDRRDDVVLGRTRARVSRVRAGGWSEQQLQLGLLHVAAVLPRDPVAEPLRIRDSGVQPQVVTVVFVDADDDRPAHATSRLLGKDGEELRDGVDHAAAEHSHAVDRLR